jgi:hypothetical protein
LKTYPRGAARDLSRFPFAASARLMSGHFRETFLRRALVNAPGIYELMRSAFGYRSKADAQR